MPLVECVDKINNAAYLKKHGEAGVTMDYIKMKVVFHHLCQGETGRFQGNSIFILLINCVGHSVLKNRIIMNDTLEQASKQAPTHNRSRETQYDNKKTSRAKIQIHKSLRCEAVVLTAIL